MTTTIFSSELLRRLRAPAALGLVVFTAACSDSDGNSVSGPSRDCVEELDLAGLPFDDDDVRAIDVGDSRSGSISTSDVEIEYEDIGLFYNDIYTFNSEDGGLIDIEVDPASGFDASLEIYDANIVRLDYQDEEGAGGTEESTGEADEDTCYMVIVSSHDPEETGSYTLRID